MSMFPSLEFWGNGPAPGQLYQFPGVGKSAYNEKMYNELTAPGSYGRQHLSTPITTGTSVLGIKFNNGVILAADNLVSYGSLAKYQDVERVFAINNDTILGAGGDFADFQSIKRSIDQKVIEDICHDDKIIMKPKSWHSWLSRIFYDRRSKLDPLWLDIVVGGMNNNEPFLSHVDLRGRAYEDDVIATGFGKHLALPLMRERISPGKPLSKQEALDVLHKCMEVLYYRDCRAISKYTIAICTKEGSAVHGPINVNENWKLAAMVRGY